jgi:hypothetical protein
MAQDSSRVMLRGRGLTAAKCGEQVSFTIDGSQAGTGTPQVQIFSPTNEVDVVLQHLGKESIVFKKLTASLSLSLSLSHTHTHTHSLTHSFPLL